MAAIDYLTFTLLEDGSGYSVKAKEELIGVSVALEIPEIYNGFPVTTIEYQAFFDCSGLTSVTIPSSITSIGEGAFFNCTGLTSITIPSSVTVIRDNVFDHCSGLTSITIPSFVKSIGNLAFNNCTSLTSITIPSSVTSIGSSAFKYCTSLTSITIPSSVTSIKDSAFEKCSGLTSITIPSSVTSIGSRAFARCNGLTSITVESGNAVYHSDENCCIETSTNTLIFGCKNSTIPDYVESILNYAFYFCTDLTSITIPSSVTSIGSAVFYMCSSLTSITIPSSVTSIGKYAFGGCAGLASITIPSSVTSIGGAAFYMCSGLTYFKFEGNSITDEPDALSYTENLKNVYVNFDATGWGETWGGKTVVIDPISYLSFTLSSDGTYYSVKVKDTSISGELEIPAEYGGLPVTIIEDRAFIGCKFLTSITIPSSVTSIGEAAFSGCSVLTSITIPSSVTLIYNHAFAECIGLTSITIPAFVKFVGAWVFYKCSGLMSVTMPSSLKGIGSAAFWDCTGLTYLKFEGNAIEEPSNVFNNTPNLSCVYVNARTTGWGETWGGKPVVKVGPNIGNAVKYGETPLIEIKLGEITIYSMFIGDDQLF